MIRDCFDVMQKCIAYPFFHAWNGEKRRGKKGKTYCIIGNCLFMKHFSEFFAFFEKAKFSLTLALHKWFNWKAASLVVNFSKSVRSFVQRRGLLDILLHTIQFTSDGCFIVCWLAMYMGRKSTKAILLYQWQLHSIRQKWIRPDNIGSCELWTGVNMVFRVSSKPLTD